jgi:peptidoglycan/xylan/chitin deacetylase (PgdA/CDA1 family)
MRRLAATALGAALLALAPVSGAGAHPGPGWPSAAPTTTRTTLTVQRLIDAGRPVYCGGQRKRLFALTFDDGPGPWTETLLRALRRGHAPATFFLIGNRIPLWQRAAAAEAAYGAVGDHTWTHPDLLGLTTPEIRRQLLWTRDAIRRRTGAPVELFRPPYEAAGARVAAIVRSLGLLDVRWNVDSGDSLPGASPGRVAREIVRNLAPGAIVLMHDTHPWTAEVVRQVLAAARRRHLWPVTVPELLTVDPPTPGENCYADVPGVLAGD